MINSSLLKIDTRYQQSIKLRDTLRILTMVLVTLCVHSLPVQALEVSIGYDTQYITEGRAQLNDGSIMWLGGTTQLDDNIHVGVVYGLALNESENYDELNIYASYASTYKDINYEISYTHLAFLKDDQTDNEIGLALLYAASFVKPFANLVYGHQAHGYFVESGVTLDYKISPSITLKPKASLAYDFGYANTQEKGFSHSALVALLEFQTQNQLVVNVLLEQTFGGSIIRNESTQSNQFWGSINLSYAW